MAESSRKCRSFSAAQRMVQMNNQEILAVAAAQSAIDSSCKPEDFFCGKSKAVLSRPHPGARRYLDLPFDLDLTSYGENVIASARNEELAAIAEEYITKYPPEHCFETPNLHVLMEKLRPLGLDVCFMAEYWLPDVRVLRPLDCAYATRLLESSDFAGLYLPQWSNALCEKRKHLDMLAVGAYEGNQLIGLAGASADCDSMWQIGIDVLPAYRKKGIASALTSRLAVEILKRGIVPFYCCAWSNLPSARNAIRSGFRPAWVQLTAKPQAFIDEMNGC